MLQVPVSTISKHFSKRSLAKYMLLGGGVALVLISLAVFTVDEPNPEWGQWWVIRPLLVTPVVGALGAAFLYMTSILPYKNEWIKFLLLVLGLIGYVISLWMGSILGLDGTLWN